MSMKIHVANIDKVLAEYRSSLRGRGCSVKRCSYKFWKFRKKPVLESVLETLSKGDCDKGVLW